VFIEDPFDQQFKPTAGFPLTMEPRPNHSGVVDDHKVARAKTVWEISELTVEHCVGAHQQKA
jgi:hypothetical protein